MTSLIFTNSNSAAGNSERLSHKHIAMLKDPKQIDDYTTFTECGWFCIIGYKKNNRVFYAHCNSSEEFEAMMNPSQQDNHFRKLNGY